jgi:hypothetical protein
MDKNKAKAVVLYELYKRNPLLWLRDCVKTIDEHDLTAPVKPFTIKPYTPFLVNAFMTEPRHYVAKSRQIMATWTHAALALHTAQFFPYRKVFVISKKEQDAHELVKRIRHIYSAQPRWLQEMCPLDKKINDQPQGTLTFRHGSEMRGLPQGADQIRMHTASLILIDEASFLDELEETYGACAPSVAGGGKIVVFSSAGSSYFGSMVEIKDRQDFGVQVCRGVWQKRNSQGVLVTTVHYTADPEKDPATENGHKWFESMIVDYIGGVSSAKFRKEMEIDFTVGIGEPVFEYLAKMESEIKFRPSVLTPHFLDTCKFYGGLDWGTRNNTAFTVVAEDLKGNFWVVWEWSDKKKSPEEVAREIRSCPFYPRLEWIAADPTMWTENQARKEGYTSFAKILIEEIPEELRLNLMPAHGRLDMAAITKLHAWWKMTPLKLRISEMCVILWRELLNLRFVDTSGDKNPSEKLVDKDNHEWDTLKYIILSHPTAGSHEEKPKYGTYGYLNKVAEAARSIASETGQNYEEIFNDLMGKI